MKKIIIIAMLLIMAGVAASDIIITPQDNTITFSNGVIIEYITIVFKDNIQQMQVKFSEVRKGALQQNIPPQVYELLENNSLYFAYDPNNYNLTVQMMILDLTHDHKQNLTSFDVGKLYDFNQGGLK